ncbi:MAG: ATP-dependent helicase, partial [Chloroflexi bacterium]|nr:ATP-dependent helicase [Chloroflexota bacterium]
ARGIDVLNISHVINYDMPDSTDAYTHRIGRTGRVDKTGDAFTLVTAEDTAMVQALERVLNARLERRKLQGFDYAAPAPQREFVGSPLRSRRSAVGRKRRNNQ